MVEHAAVTERYYCHFEGQQLRIIKHVLRHDRVHVVFHLRKNC